MRTSKLPKSRERSLENQPIDLILLSDIEKAGKNMKLQPNIKFDLLNFNESKYQYLTSKMNKN